MSILFTNHVIDKTPEYRKKLIDRGKAIDKELNDSIDFTDLLIHTNVQVACSIIKYLNNTMTYGTGNKAAKARSLLELIKSNLMKGEIV